MVRDDDSGFFHTFDIVVAGAGGRRFRRNVLSRSLVTQASRASEAHRGTCICVRGAVVRVACVPMQKLQHDFLSCESTHGPGLNDISIQSETNGTRPRRGVAPTLAALLCPCTRS
jgi:hypothetical protein